MKTASTRKRRIVVAATGRKSTAGSKEPRASRPHAPGYGIADADAGEGLLPWSWASAQMEKSRTYWLCTLHPKGRPHVMPIWGIWMDDAFYFGTGRETRKFRNLAENAACTVCNDNAEEAVILEGVAEEINDPKVFKRLESASQRKYGMGGGSGEPVFAVRPRVVFGFIEKKFPATATRWTFG